MVGEEAHLRDSVKSEKKMKTSLTRSERESEGQALTSVMVRKQATGLEGATVDAGRSKEGKSA